MPVCVSSSFCFILSARSRLKVLQYLRLNLLAVYEKWSLVTRVQFSDRLKKTLAGKIFETSDLSDKLRISESQCQKEKKQMVI